MALKLSHKPESYLFFGGKKIKIKPCVKNVLLCLDILEDAILTDSDKVNLCLKILAGKRKIENKPEFLTEIFEFLAGDKKGRDTEKVLDFKQDADAIYAAFWQTYGMDFFSKKVQSMHWHTFMALFSNLPETTRIMQIIDIRARPLPKPTKYNVEERQQLMRLKALHRLEMPQEEKEKQLAQGLWKMAEVLQSIAKKGGT